MSDSRDFYSILAFASLAADKEILDPYLNWTNPGDEVRGTLFLKDDAPPVSARKIEPATAYELVCFAFRPDGCKVQVDWKRYDMVVALGSKYRVDRKIRYVCLEQERNKLGKLVGKNRSVLRSKKVRELLVAF